MATEPVVVTRHTVETRVVTVTVAPRTVTHVVVPYITLPVTRYASPQAPTTSTAQHSTGSKGVRTASNIIGSGGSANQVLATSPTGGGAGSSKPSRKTSSAKDTAGYWKNELDGVIEALSFKLKVLTDKGYGPVDKIYGEIEDLLYRAEKLGKELEKYRDSDRLPDALLTELRSLVKKAGSIDVDGLPDLNNPDISVVITDPSDAGADILLATASWLSKKPVLRHYMDMAKYLLAAITAYAGMLTEDTYNMLRKTVEDAINDLALLQNLVESGHFDPHKPDALRLLDRVVNEAAAVKTMYDKLLPRLLGRTSNKLALKALRGDKASWEKLDTLISSCVSRECGDSVGPCIDGWRKCIKKYGLTEQQYELLRSVYENLGKKPDEMKPGPSAEMRWGLDRLAKYVYLPLTLGSEAAQYLYRLADKNKDNPALSTAYMLLGLLAQAGGAVATGAEAGLIGALTGGVGLAVFAGIGLADLANQVSYYFTDPVFRDAVDKLVQDAENGRLTPEEYGAIAGAIVTLAAMPLGDKVFNIRLGGRLSIYDKILDAKKLVYGRIAERLSKIIDRVRKTSPGLAKSLNKLYLKALEKASYKVGIARLKGTEQPEEAELIAVPRLDEDGNLEFVLLAKEKGRIVGEYTIEPLDTRFYLQMYREGKSPIDVELEITRQILRKFENKMTPEQVRDTVNHIIDVLNRLGKNKDTVKDAVEMIDDIVKGRFRVGVVTRARYRADYLVVGGDKSGRIIVLPEKGRPAIATYVVRRGENSVAEIRFTGSSEGVPREVFDKLVFQLTDTDAFKDVHLIDVETPNQNTVIMYRSGDRWSFLTEKGAVVTGRSGDVRVKIGDAVFDAKGLVRNLYVASRDGRYISIVAGTVRFSGRDAKALFGEMLRLGVDPDTGAGFQKLLTQGFRTALEELRSGKPVDAVAQDVYSELFNGLGRLGMSEEAADKVASGLGQELVQIAEQLAKEKGAEKVVPVGVVMETGDGGLAIQVRLVGDASASQQLVRSMTAEEKAVVIDRALSAGGSSSLKALAREISKETGMPENMARELVESTVSRMVEETMYEYTAGGARGGVVSVTKTLSLETMRPEELELRIPLEEQRSWAFTTMEKPGETVGVTRTLEKNTETAMEEKSEIPVAEQDTWLETKVRVGGGAEAVTKTETLTRQGAREERLDIPVRERDTWLETVLDKTGALPVTREATSEYIVPETINGVAVPVEKTITLTLTLPVYEQVLVPAEKMKAAQRGKTERATGTPVPAPPLPPAVPSGGTAIGGAGEIGGEGKQVYEIVQI